MTWSKAEIRHARKIPLAPLLQQRGFALRELPGQNYRVEAFGDLTVRESYWIWKSKQLQGNTIDFFVMVENMSFAQTMQSLLGDRHSTDPTGQNHTPTEDTFSQSHP